MNSFTTYVLAILLITTAFPIAAQAQSNQSGLEGEVDAGLGISFGGSIPNAVNGDSEITRPSIVCEEKGPCYKKKLTCPAKCLGAGGGGCTMDCHKKCIAYC